MSPDTDYKCHFAPPANAVKIERVRSPPQKAPFGGINIVNLLLVGCSGDQG